MASPLRSIAALTLSLTCASATPQNPVFETKIKERQATVNIMALTAITHRGFSGNQDTYLADIGFKQGEHELARLVDFYPQAANPIQRSVLTDRRALKMRPHPDTCLRRPLQRRPRRHSLRQHLRRKHPLHPRLPTRRDRPLLQGEPRRHPPHQEVTQLQVC